jgi:hypothetical protein
LFENSFYFFLLVEKRCCYKLSLARTGADGPENATGWQESGGKLMPPKPEFLRCTVTAENRPGEESYIPWLRSIETKAFS